MAKNCNVVVRRVRLEPLNSCPFNDSMSIRELARQTGLDPTYLSKVKRGLIPVTEKNLAKIERVLAAAL